MSATGQFKISDFQAYANKKRASKNREWISPIPLTDADIETFLKVCNYLRSIGDGLSNSAIITIDDEQLRIDAKHIGEVNEGTVVTTSNLCLSAVVEFYKEDEIDSDHIADFKSAVEYVSVVNEKSESN